MKSAMITLLAITGLAAAVFAGSFDYPATNAKGTYTYTYTYPYFVVNVAEGTEVALGSAAIVKVESAEDEGTVIPCADFLAAKTGTFVKDGTGTLKIDVGLANWTGDMHVMNGVMHVNHLDGFGPSSGNNSVYVHNGATLLNENPPGVLKLDANNYSCRRVIAFEGEGYDSMGALRVVNDIGESSWAMMCYPTLTDDATLMLDNKHIVYMNWRPPTELRLNGHTLWLKNAEGRTRPCFRLNDPDIVTSGNLIVDGIDFQTYYDFPFDSKGGSIIFTNEVSFTTPNLKTNGRRVWPLYILGDMTKWDISAELNQVKGEEGDVVDEYGNKLVNGSKIDINPWWAWDPDVTRYNSWDAPVYLGGMVPLRNNLSTVNVLGESTHNTGLTFNGPVSGPGGFVPYQTTSSRYYSDIALQLNSLENTFTGGVVLGDGCRLIVRGNGSLPAAGAACSITNGSMILCGEDELSLPELKFHGTGLVERASFTGGNASGVTKTGEGELVWNTSVGAQTLELKGGAFVYPEITPDWSQVAGLLEYTNKYEITGTIFESGVAIRADGRPPVMSPLTAYGAKNSENQTWSMALIIGENPETGEVKYANGNNGCANWIYSYRGYIWNRTDSDVTWGLISVMDKGARVIIDGEIVVNQYTNDTKYCRNHAKTGSVTLSPGPHEFEFRYFCTSGNSGGTNTSSISNVFSFIDEEYFPTNATADAHSNPAIGVNGGKWVPSFGFGIDYQGARKSHNYEDYAKAIDAGDGMLFTHATNVLEVSVSAPAFGEIAAAAGTALDLSGREVTLPKLTGLPAVHDGTLTVTESWVIPGADVAAGAAIAGTGKFVLASGAAVTVDDLTALPRGNFTLVETAGGVEIPDGFETRLDSRGRYRLKGADGKLTVEYSCGTKLIFR